MNKGIVLKWLNGVAHENTGTTWGIPWKEGELKREEALCLATEDGGKLPVQSWPTAYWPDGSVKWTAHSASFGDLNAGQYYLSKGENIEPQFPIVIIENENSIAVNTGKIICEIGKNGISVIKRIMMNGESICSDGRLVCIREERKVTSGLRSISEEDFESHITNAVVEKSGPVRVVVKIEGKHKMATGLRTWLPFELRLCFYAGQDSIKAVHTFFYDGNPHQDFIKGLGIRFTIPMRGPLYNRHVRLAGDTGFFCESPKGMRTHRSYRNKYEELYKEQQEGKFISFNDEEDGAFLKLLDDSATWDSFKLVQNSPDNYFIQKRTREGCSWLHAITGNRAGGYVYAGSEIGGLGIGLKNFWQKYPASLELQEMTKNDAQLTVWFWSPDAEAMDLRHYDTETHVASAYEGFNEMRSTPFGVANTSELSIWCCSKTPSYQEMADMKRLSQEAPILVCEPEHYHDSKAFGIWSVEDRSTEVKTWLEEQNDKGIEYFKEEIEQRKWYGFWNYGDIMRFYDTVSHTWRYDLGGCAWNNSEIVPNMWLWYSFLRSGRADVFRMAENFTRHASEVDQYHFGDYKGLGSRHNVVHWGCGCKEARISMAGLHRFYYYLTGDERVGEILDEVKDADYTLLTIDPLRSIVPKDEYPTHARSGPDWAAFVSNWMTQWERYEDESYRDKILTGINSLKEMPNQLNSGPMFGYDPKSGKLYNIGDNNQTFHMVNCFGALQIWMELSTILKNSEWDNMLADYGEFYLLDFEEKKKRRPDILENKYWGLAESVLAISAFAAARKKDKALAEKVWSMMIRDFGGYPQGRLTSVLQSGMECPYPVKEVETISSGIGLGFMAAFASTELIYDWLPDKEVLLKKVEDYARSL